MNASSSRVARVRRNCHVTRNVDSGVIQGVDEGERCSVLKRKAGGLLKAGDDPAATARYRRQLLGDRMDEAGDSWDTANGRGTWACMSS